MSAELTIFLVASLASWIVRTRPATTTTTSPSDNDHDDIDNDTAFGFGLERDLARPASASPAASHSTTLSILRSRIEWTCQEGPALLCY
ncbi:hypothetical protein DFJ77DRAFT_458210 [Powellomyces hirtus]|nr:hypothetical protein DFJ77DRAFT_481473 [Powellomyces hirtus]KAI8917899.1 hypothetical protein DFJ77DRAFT_458210 [Powellomyces hirtus]